MVEIRIDGVQIEGLYGRQQREIHQAYLDAASKGKHDASRRGGAIYVDKAKHKRHCHMCGGKIRKGELCLIFVFKRVGAFWVQKKNVCRRCCRNVARQIMDTDHYIDRDIMAKHEPEIVNRRDE